MPPDSPTRNSAVTSCAGGSTSVRRKKGWAAPGRQEAEDHKRDERRDSELWRSMSGFLDGLPLISSW